MCNFFKREWMLLHFELSMKVAMLNFQPSQPSCSYSVYCDNWRSSSNTQLLLSLLLRVSLSLRICVCLADCWQVTGHGEWLFPQNYHIKVCPNCVELSLASMILVLFCNNMAADNLNVRTRPLTAPTVKVQHPLVHRGCNQESGGVNQGQTEGRMCQGLPLSLHEDRQAWYRSLSIGLQSGNPIHNEIPPDWVKVQAIGLAEPVIYICQRKGWIHVSSETALAHFEWQYKGRQNLQWWRCPLNMPSAGLLRNIGKVRAKSQAVFKLNMIVSWLCFHLSMSENIIFLVFVLLFQAPGPLWKGS